MRLPDVMVDEPDWIEVRMPLWRLQDLAEKHHAAFRTHTNAFNMRSLYFVSHPIKGDHQRNIIAQWKKGVARFPYKWHGTNFPAHKLDINA